MAVLFPPRFRATDSNGDPISGATLTVYNTGTTTPASIYTDAALTNPMANPVAALGNGWFPQIYGAEGAIVDLLPSAGWEFDGEGVQFLGGSSSTLERDFGGSRFQVRNSGGVVQIETGDATGDDAGGQARMGGWDGTQGDDLEIDYANVTISGTLEVGGFAPAHCVVAASTFSATNLDIALPNSPAGIRAWDIDLLDITCGSNGDVLMRFSVDGGATYLSTGDYANTIVNAGTGSVTSAGAALQTSGKLGVHTTAYLSTAQVRLYSGSASNAMPRAVGVYDALGNGYWFRSSYNLAVARVTHVRFIFPAAATGRYRVATVRELGE